MSTSVISSQCTTKPSPLFRLVGLVQVTPDHNACPGGQTVPGVMGGWVCSCKCHQEATDTTSVATTKELS
jgi:hypothetical protein